MRSLAVASLTLLVAAVCSTGCTRTGAGAPRPASGPRVVRVLVFNIHAGKDADREPNLDAVARLVREHDVDVALLQEVDRGTRRSGGVDQLQVLAEKTGFAPVMGRSLDYDGGEYGIAALARGGFVHHQTYPLPVTPPQERAGGAHEPRVALVAVARTRLGELQVVNTHLDSLREDHYRRQEAAHVLEIAKRLRRGPHPVVLGGDFNAEPDSAVLEQLRTAGLRDAGLECGQGAQFTFPARAPVKRIDYLFLTGSVRCSSAVVIDTTASDHRPLLVTLTW